MSFASVNRFLLPSLLTGLLCAAGLSAQTGDIRGHVKLADGGAPLHGASVHLSPLGRIASTDEKGEFSFSGVPAGDYSLMAHMHALADEKQSVTVRPGEALVVEFTLRLSTLRESITVTASGQEETVMESFQSVTSLEGYKLTARSGSTSLGDLLDQETGVAKRSSGPGSSRPVVRGFDGDRVLILQDGMRTGTLSSQSGDHGEPVDSSNIERVEVVKGPATLLYGSNAIGGVVNVLTDHHIINQHPHEGLHMTLNGVGGSGNAQLGGGGSFEYGAGDWMIYGSGGGMRTGDYRTPVGAVLNSGGELTNFKAGAGRFGEKFSFNSNFQNVETTYGIPVESAAGEMSVPKMRRNNVRFNGAVKQMRGFAEQFQFDLNYSDYTHREVVEGITGTQFFNKQFTYRGTLNQKKRGPLTGSLGFWGLRRDYEARGAEALTPPVTHGSQAVFGLEELTFKRIRLQFGARLERNAYSPAGLAHRGFTGLSGSAGAYLPTWKNGALVVNYMHSYRAPALEELYNMGPHPGNLAFEIGNPDLRREKSDGVEASMRHQSGRVRLEASAFSYQMHDFVYFQPAGTEVDGLPVYYYRQHDARFLGAEARLQFLLARSLWLNTGLDYVDANLTGSGINLPRIPPGRGRAGLDWFWKGLNIRPELVLANKQWQLAPNETKTPGYALLNLNASYTRTTQHLMHTFSVNTFNLGDRLYYNHLNFLKSFAPEIGRGVRLGYTLQWF
ncbi:MAG: TonB-dependent receptor [Acidobacteria bacterium]|nr:TonB-dependent receptor [Acidobacteriota bacterium]